MGVGGSFQLEKGSYGRRAIIEGNWQPNFAKEFERKHVVELELNDGKGWKRGDISFLTELPWLQSFDIFDFKAKDVSPIHALNGLRHLGISTYCSTEIRFLEFPNLESVGLEWRPKAKSIFDSKCIKKLFVNRYKGKDVQPFGNLTNLESLTILNAPIENILGLEGLTKLRSLRLGGLRCLRSLAGVEHLANLESLDINTCRALSQIDEIGSLNRLRNLNLNNLGEIESLKPLDRLNLLETINFDESTNILDGDISPLLRQKRLTRTSFQNRRHYSHQREALSSYR